MLLCLYEIYVFNKFIWVWKKHVWDFPSKSWWRQWWRAILRANSIVYTTWNNRETCQQQQQNNNNKQESNTHLVGHLKAVLKLQRL